MKLQLNTDASIQLVHSYQDRIILINEQPFNHGVIVTPQQVVDLNLNQLSELSTEHFEQLASFRPEIAILGTGPSQVFPDFALSKMLVEQQIGLEVMDSKAACRTYNILASDGRKVAALLLC